MLPPRLWAPAIAGTTSHAESTGTNSIQRFCISLLLDHSGTINGSEEPGHAPCASRSPVSTPTGHSPVDQLNKPRDRRVYNRLVERPRVKSRTTAAKNSCVDVHPC